MDKKTLVIIDTNKLGKFKSGSFSFEKLNYLDTNKDLLNIILRVFKDNKNITISIPEIVFQELIYEQERVYLKKFKQLKDNFSKFDGIPSLELKYEEIDYKTYLNGLKDSFITTYNIVVLPTPSNLDINEFITKSLEKKAPFRKPKKGDAGIKDQVIWESILTYVKQNKFDNYLFLTEDKDFEAEELLSEFVNITNKKIEIIRDIGGLKSRLNEILDDNRAFIELIELTKTKSYNVIKLLNELPTSIIKDSKSYNIKEWKTFEILDIEKKDSTYELLLEFEIINETPYSGWGIVDVNYQHYESEVNLVKIKLLIEDNKICKIKSEDVLFYGDDSIDLFDSKKIDLK